MAAVLNRSTLEFMESVNTPDYDPALWIINPDLSAVDGYPPIYWVISGDSVTLMDADQRAVRDTTVPYDGLDLAGAIGLKTTAINSYRDVVLNRGWSYNGIMYDSTADSRQNMAGTMTLIATGYTLPSTFSWRTTDNANTPFDNAGFTRFYQISCVWVEANYEVSWAHKAAVSTLTTISDVIAYDHTTNWISGYTVGANGITPVA